VNARKCHTMAVDARSLQLYLRVCVFGGHVGVHNGGKCSNLDVKDEVKAGLTVCLGNDVAAIGIVVFWRWTTMDSDTG